jgi:hypothetical protein
MIVNGLRMIATLALVLICQGCIVAPLPVSSPLDVSVVDAETGAPIARAAVVYFVCDIHDFDCSEGRLVRTESGPGGKVTIPRRWRWGLWIAAPGGLPVPNHFIAIQAPGYAPFVFSQYEDSLERVIARIGVTRPDVAAELRTLPAGSSSSDRSINASSELIGGKIRLRRLARVQ